MLFRNSLSSSKNANCQDLEDIAEDNIIHNGIFTLSYEKTTSVDEDITPFLCVDDYTFSHYQKNILYYIAASAAHKFLEKFPCTFCEDIILNQDIFRKDHNYSLMPISDYICFTNFKTRGKLRFVSTFIFDIILYTEKCYQAYSLNMKENNLKKDITLKVQRYFMTQIKNLKPEHPIVDTCTLECHEIKIVKLLLYIDIN